MRPCEAGTSLLHRPLVGEPTVTRHELIPAGPVVRRNPLHSKGSSRHRTDGLCCAGNPVTSKTQQENRA
ncbi:hypothetical protein GCM10022222_10290 [Amycolatopsis ultiminotia]|uniref:Uncharacterized protein n=1 Tax=Amycolatopsis ultiminotia TaxID=543629 RepID=A0ABP6V8V3_9PSEU